MCLLVEAGRPKPTSARRLLFVEPQLLIARLLPSQFTALRATGRRRYCTPSRRPHRLAAHVANYFGPMPTEDGLAKGIRLSKEAAEFDARFRRTLETLRSRRSSPARGIHIEAAGSAAVQINAGSGPPR